MFSGGGNKHGSSAAKSGKSVSSGRSSETLGESGGDSDVSSLSKAMSGASVGYIPKYMMPTFLEQNILSGDIRKYVTLPKYTSREEWISSHGKCLRPWAAPLSPLTPLTMAPCSV